MDALKVRGSGQCPTCGCRKVGALDQPVTPFYAPRIEVCANCGAAWEPFDPAKLLDAEDPKTSSFTEPCDNCAFRKGSSEQQDKEYWDDLMIKITLGGAWFFCHKGVPITPGDGHGFAYPVTADGKPDIRKLRYCRGFLNMFRKHLPRAGGRP